MTSMHESPESALTNDLAALRVALRDVRAPADGEVTLRAALWVRRQAAPRAPRGRRLARAVWLAAAAALGAVAVAALLPRAASRDPGAHGTAAEDFGPPPASRGQLAPSAFQPLAFTPGLSASQSYSVVRVRIPLAALAPDHASPSDATIEADLLVGDDGLARGIRFDTADTLLVAAR
jgi:hypothetical protein